MTDSKMNRAFERFTSLGAWPWRERAARAAVALLTIFAGVTAAFIVDEYRAHLGEMDRLRQAREGIIAELARYEVRGLQHANGITESIERWRAADRLGQKAVPGFYRIPGATHPPSAAWDAAVSSGVSNLFDPQLRVELGYFYTEFLGVHDNYARYHVFSEREILPRAERGAGAFYDSSGMLMPEFRIHMALMDEFGADLRKLIGLARDLRVRLENEAE